jgi:hypothetical protein
LRDRVWPPITEATDYRFRYGLKPRDSSGFG